MKGKVRHLLYLVVSIVLLFGPVTLKAEGLYFLENNPELKARLFKWEKEAPEDVKKEINILRTGAEGAKGLAAFRLAKMGDRAKGAILALVETFKDLPSPVATIIALREIGEPAVEPLISALKDKDSGVREGAVLSLGEIKDPRAVEPLISALKDKDRGVRFMVTRVLGEIDPYWPSSEAAKRAVPVFISALKDKDSGVREGAAEALGEIKDPRVVNPLIGALKDEDLVVRYVVAEVLGKIKDPRAVEPLISALKDKDRGVRFMVTRALGKIGEPAVEPLISALEDKDSGVRERAAKVLGEITGKDFGESYQEWKSWWESKK